MAAVETQANITPLTYQAGDKIIVLKVQRPSASVFIPVWPCPSAVRGRPPRFADMCTGACSKFVAISLYPLAALSVICNIFLFFPDFSTEYASEDSADTPRLTEEVKYMGGLVGGGIMVLVPAIHIHLTSARNCCANRCGMFLSIGFAALGVVGAIYSMSAAALGLSNGPMCLFTNADNPKPSWGAPFANSSGSYLSDSDLWTWCVEPEGVVQFNLGLFATLLVASSLQLILCLVQMINGLFGCLCGTCGDKE